MPNRPPACVPASGILPIVATAVDETSAANYRIVDEIVRRALFSVTRLLAVDAEDVPGGGPAEANAPSRCEV